MAEVVKKEVQAVEPTEMRYVTLSPQVDIYELEDAYVALFDLPGVEKGHLTLRLEENRLSLEARVEDPLLERHLGQSGYRYQRTFVLGDDVDPNHVEAELKDGVLELRIGKREQLKPRTIEIK
ncbi:MAG: Hsp20/alpha crystallin family protein [Bacteroidetes bacterium]|nr:Hsp20/alpha crystallin family protein [Rhodothermia bacterium]MCS7154375.1 Hsp20/alpha crystallin family protein [Bacteroidota bacterium]MCX7907620.1 Hsp20/alpha crystallin family protein [Bacteroidota bacterium]MDW8137750.1 Hsp20/alpha crystallin family protein [Bacteroidota bacterium]MDW8286400.1 Hsp20/alpha crystallin family protein [Bacteroidota bacterium]